MWLIHVHLRMTWNDVETPNDIRVIIHDEFHVIYTKMDYENQSIRLTQSASVHGSTRRVYSASSMNEFGNHSISLLNTLLGYVFWNNKVHVLAFNSTKSQKISISSGVSDLVKAVLLQFYHTQTIVFQYGNQNFRFK
jgi:hypothetical protein